jgi:hypothetical protein
LIMSEEENACYRCRKTIDNNENVMKCFVCKRSYCVECEDPKIGRDEQRMVNEKLKGDWTKARGLRWVCRTCDGDLSLDAAQILLGTSKEFMRKFEEKINQLEEIIKRMEKKEPKSNDPAKQSWSTVVSIVHKDPKKKEASSSSRKLRETVREIVDPSKVQAGALRKSRNGGVTFNCKTGKNKQKLQKEMDEAFGEEFEVKISDEKKPRVKIIGLYDDKESSAEELEGIIKKQNKELVKASDYLKIVKVSNWKTNNVKTLIAEVECDVYHRLLEVGKMNINWSRCNILDGVEVMRCYNCSRYAHKGKFCESEKCCPKCMQKHSLTEHDEENKEEKCINCHEANERLNLGLDINHAVWSRECTVYKQKLQLTKRKFEIKLH